MLNLCIYIHTYMTVLDNCRATAACWNTFHWISSCLQLEMVELGVLLEGSVCMYKLIETVV